MPAPLSHVRTPRSRQGDSVSADSWALVIAGGGQPWDSDTGTGAGPNSSAAGRYPLGRSPETLQIMHSEDRTLFTTYSVRHALRGAEEPLKFPYPVEFPDGYRHCCNLSGIFHSMIGARLDHRRVDLHQDMRSALYRHLERPDPHINIITVPQPFQHSDPGQRLSPD